MSKPSEKPKASPPPPPPPPPRDDPGKVIKDYKDHKDKETIKK